MSKLILRGFRETGVYSGHAGFTADQTGYKGLWRRPFPERYQNAMS
jgi:hypothetical protein